MSKLSCLNCKERELGCHGNCERYIDYAKNRAVINELKKEDKKFDDYLFNAMQNMKNKRGVMRL